MGLVETRDEVGGSPELGPWGVIDTQQNGNLVLAPSHPFGNEVPGVAPEKANWVSGEAKRTLADSPGLVLLR